MMEETDSAELKKLDVGSWKDPNYAGEKIPYLEEILQTIPEKRTFFIEIKCGPEILPYLKEIIDQSGKEKQLTIISFNLDVAAGAKRMMPKIPVYWLVGTEEDKQTKQPIPHSVDLIKTAAEKGLDGLDLNYKGITPDFAQEVFKSNLKLYAWTVDDLHEAHRLKQMGICGITTNRPDYLMKNLLCKESKPELP
jgi:glycerophosphoryl diester phosphodiesterase